MRGLGEASFCQHPVTSAAGRGADYYGSPLRVRGLARVQLHADLTMLARLAQALSRTRVVALAA